jgi:hypothetical protein
LTLIRNTHRLFHRRTFEGISLRASQYLHNAVHFLLQSAKEIAINAALVGQLDQLFRYDDNMLGELLPALPLGCGDSPVTGEALRL